MNCQICNSDQDTAQHGEYILCDSCATKAFDYERKMQARLERWQARAAKAHAESQAAFKQAHEIASYIPFGQPILVGHHSERRHRRDADRIESAMRRGVQALERAQRLEDRRGSTAISSDNPMAILELQAKLSSLEKEQELMKAANKVIRKFTIVDNRKAKEEVFQATHRMQNLKIANFIAGAALRLSDLEIDEAGCIPALVALGISEKAAKALLVPDFAKRVGFPSYALSNTSAEIRRLKERIAALHQRQQVKSELEAETGAAVLEEQHGDVRLVRHMDDNRLRLFFPGKPSPEIIALLKSNGFRWSPANKAWQRQLNKGAEVAARYVLGKVQA